MVSEDGRPEYQMLRGKRRATSVGSLRWERVLQTIMNEGSLHGGGGFCQSLVDNEETE